jgi:hypothetical protein
MKATDLYYKLTDEPIPGATGGIITPIREGQVGQISDGYHTFDELYEHRMALTRALTKRTPHRSWRSKQHHPNGDPMFEGFFIVGMDLPAGQISYHYKLEHWDKFSHVKELEHAPEWDGHTPTDVITRLNDWSAKPSRIHHEP